MKLAELIVLVGPAAAGKSSTARALVAGGLPASSVVSSDALRATLTDDEGDQECSELVFDLMRRIVEHRCSRGLTTVVDATNLAASNRQIWLTIARASKMPVVAVLHDVLLAELIRRNAARDRHVPVEVLVAMDAAYRGIGDLVAEGFAEVRYGSL